MNKNRDYQERLDTKAGEDEAVKLMGGLTTAPVAETSPGSSDDERALVQDVFKSLRHFIAKDDPVGKWQDRFSVDGKRPPLIVPQDDLWVILEETIHDLRRRLTGPSVTRERLELEALLTERAGMDAENAWRARRGEASAYGMDHYNEIADRIRSIGIHVEEKNGGAE